MAARACSCPLRRFKSRLKLKSREHRLVFQFPVFPFIRKGKHVKRHKAREHHRGSDLVIGMEVLKRFVKLRFRRQSGYKWQTTLPALFHSEAIANYQAVKTTDFLLITCWEQRIKEVLILRFATENNRSPAFPSREFPLSSNYLTDHKRDLLVAPCLEKPHIVQNSIRILQDVRTCSGIHPG
jgi:hypothetical protein